MNNIEFIVGGGELLKDISDLWNELRNHHVELSPYFADEMKNFHFEERKNALVKKSAGGKIRVELAKSNDSNRYVAYCVSTINKDNIGEIDSLFVEETFRGKGVGEALMRHAIDWLDSEKVESKVLNVAVGNEKAFSFYSKFGFYPRHVVLKGKG